MTYELARADYYAFTRTAYAPTELSQAGPWDFFVSAYEDTERVETPFRTVRARFKEWLIHEEYAFADEGPDEGGVALHGSFEPPAIVKYVAEHAEQLRMGRLCVDITGFIRPHLLILLRALKEIGVRRFDTLYSDPIRYQHGEATRFSGTVTRVEQVVGYEGVHPPLLGREDILVIGAGYDYEQIARACEEKKSSKKYLITGLPGLQPHMYQESVLQIDEAQEWIGPLVTEQRLYAAANQPFAVAQVLHDLVQAEDAAAEAENGARGNLYLCPTGPKPHVLGFGVFYLRELQDSNASVIYPFSNAYVRRTTEGLLRTWRYSVEL